MNEGVVFLAERQGLEKSMAVSVAWLNDSKLIRTELVFGLLMALVNRQFHVFSTYCRDHFTLRFKAEKPHRSHALFVPL